MAFLRLLAAFVAVACVAPAAWAAGVYHWCYAQTGLQGSAGATRYYSGIIFAEAVDGSAISNDFWDHVQAKYNPTGNLTANTCNRADTRSDAARARDNDIVVARKANTGTVRTGWTWQGRDLRGPSASWREHTIFAVQSADVVAPRKRKPRPAAESEAETADTYVACSVNVKTVVQFGVSAAGDPLLGGPHSEAYASTARRAPIELGTDEGLFYGTFLAHFLDGIPDTYYVNPQSGRCVFGTSANELDELLFDGSRLTCCPDWLK